MVVRKLTRNQLLKSEPRVPRWTLPTTCVLNTYIYTTSQRQKEICAQLASKLIDTAHIAFCIHWTDDMFTASQMHIGQTIMTSLWLLSTISCWGLWSAKPFLLHGLFPWETFLLVITVCPHYKTFILITVCVLIMGLQEVALQACPLAQAGLNKRRKLFQHWASTLEIQRTQ